MNQNDVAAIRRAWRAADDAYRHFKTIVDALPDDDDDDYARVARIMDRLRDVETELSDIETDAERMVSRETESRGSDA